MNICINNIFYFECVTTISAKVLKHYAAIMYKSLQLGDRIQGNKGRF